MDNIINTDDELRMKQYFLNLLYILDEGQELNLGYLTNKFFKLKIIHYKELQKFKIMYTTKNILNLESKLCTLYEHNLSYSEIIDIKVIDEIIFHIKNTKFSKLTGFFYLYNRQNLNYRTIENNNIFTKHDSNLMLYVLFPEFLKNHNCCVCFDETMTITNCGHYICVICWDKILETNKNNGCPLCRSCICFVENVDIVCDCKY